MMKRMVSNVLQLGLVEWHSHGYIAGHRESSAANPGQSSVKASNEDCTPSGTDSENAPGAGVPAEETVSRGEGVSGDDGPSGDTAVGGKETSEEDPGNNTEEPTVLTMGNQATSMFKSAIRETIRMKKVDDRERYALYAYLR